MALDGPRLEPKSGKAKQLVVFLHGYGADGNDLIDIGLAWQNLLPDAAFVSPHAPRPCGQAPVGREWFPLTFRDPNERWTGVNMAAPVLQEFLDAELARHGLPPRCLAIEITESTAMRDAAASLAVLRELAELGVSISIDDFGTGYSSLLYLKRLPATELKIDRGFVNQLEHDNEDAAIVSAIIALGQKLNLKIVAEGVETLAQQSFLTEMGCDSLQGFLLGRPLPAAEFLAHTLQPQPA